MTLPACLFLTYKIGIRFFYGVVIAGALLLSVCIALDIAHVARYTGLAICFGFTCFGAYRLGTVFQDLTKNNSAAIASLKKVLQTNQQDSTVVSSQIESEGNAVDRSIYMYTVIKGLAETINWKGMAPIIGKAVRRFLDARECAL
jgi:hypothetical protein